MGDYKIGGRYVFKEEKSAYYGYEGVVTSIKKDYIVISNGTSSLIVQTNENLTDKQEEMLDTLESLKNGDTPWQRDIELYSNNWVTARKLENKGLVEIYTNEINQTFVKLKEVDNG